MIVAVLLLVGGTFFAAGARCLLHVRHARYDHLERMAEIASARALQDDEVEQRRAERAQRAERAEHSRPDIHLDLVDDPVADEPGDEPDAETEVLPALLSGNPVDGALLCGSPVGITQEILRLRTTEYAESGVDSRWPSTTDHQLAEDEPRRLPTTL